MLADNEVHLHAILNRNHNEKSLIEAAQQLQTLCESRDFWIELIRDKTYSPIHRRLAFVQYFIRHSFYKMAGDLGLRSLDVSPFEFNLKVIHMVAGVIPVETPVENAIVGITCPFGEAGSASIWISIFPCTGDSELASILFGRKTGSCQVITDVAACEELTSGAYILWKRWQRRQVYEPLHTK